jgi:hypothetical protein
MQRVAFSINAGASPVGDTGPSINGVIRQMAWVPTTGDTGANFDVLLAPLADDTGGAINIFSKENILGTPFIRSLVVKTVGADDFDTGVDSSNPPVAAGERLLVRIVPSQAACVGKLYFWIESDGC